MKCPKCGYNSFEIHDTCKKCAHDLTSYKDIHGIKSIVLPHESRTVMAEKLMADKVQDAPAAVVDTPTDMFSFDIPHVETTADAAPFIKDDPFDFGGEPAAPSLGGGGSSFGNEQLSAQAKAEEDAFADLLERHHVRRPQEMLRRNLDVRVQPLPLDSLPPKAIGWRNPGDVVGIAGALGVILTVTSIFAAAPRSSSARPAGCWI